MKEKVMRNVSWLSCVVMTILSVSALHAADWGLKKGTPQLMSAGPLAFGPDGILLVGDVDGLAVFAIDTGDSKGDPNKIELRIESIDEKVADLLEVGSQGISINDLAVNPASGRMTSEGSGGNRFSSATNKPAPGAPIASIT